MKCVLNVYPAQIDENRVFLYEQPANAKSWQVNEMTRFRNRNGVAIPVYVPVKGQRSPQRTTHTCKEAHEAHD